MVAPLTPVPPYGVIPPPFVRSYLAQGFPQLTVFSITGPQDPRQNCFGFTVGKYGFIWPPDKMPHDPWLAMDQAYGFYGLVRAAKPSPPGRVVAVYAAGGVPQHVALRVDDTWWESKLGQDLRILHLQRDLEGPVYGSVVCYYNERQQP